MSAAPPSVAPAPPDIPVIDAPSVPFVEIEALRAEQFIPAAKEALTSLLAEQAQGKLIRPVFNWAGRN
jgi:hypothetical protein